MKNVNVLPTDKSSRLYIGDNQNFVFGFTQTSIQSINDCFTNQHIYITSDEEIIVGDLLLYTRGNRIHYQKLEDKNDVELANIEDSGAFKIILTTDTDLNADGVQAIDDEFLEWFVKNPSCEEVVVIYEPKNFFDVKKGWEYKIIIPKEELSTKLHKGEVVDESYPEAFRKEESKQTLIDMMKSDEELGLYEQTKCYCGHTITCNCGPLEEPKQWLKNPKWGVRLTKDKKLNFKVDFLKLVYPESPSFSSVNWKIFDTKELAEEWIKNPILSNEKPKQETLEQTFSLEQISKNFMGEIQNGGYFDDYIDFKLGLDTYNTESFRVHADSIKDRRYITFKTWFETIRENNYER